MALDDIIKKINSDANKKVDDILAEAKKAADCILKEAKSNADKRKEYLQSKSNLAADEEKKRVIILAKLDLRKNLLTEKRKLIDNVFDQVQSEIKNLDDSKYKSFIQKLLSEYVSSGNETVIPPRGHSKIWNSKFISELNKTLNKGTAQLKLSADTGTFEEGFILKDGFVETDCTISAIVKSLKEKYETKIDKILFCCEDK